MKLNKILRLANELKPNALSDEMKTQYINEVEGIVQSDVMLLSSADIVTYDPVTDSEVELLVKPPHDKLYIAYLTAMIDFANGEYNRYANTISLFTTYLDELKSWYFNRFHPADESAEIEGYYISAYAIAVNHGYSGTEEEWIDSLVGTPGSTVELRYNNGSMEWKYITESIDAWRVLFDAGGVAEAAASAIQSADNAALSENKASEAAYESTQAALSAAASEDAARGYAAQASSAEDSAEAAAISEGNAAASAYDADQSAGAAAESEEAARLYALQAGAAAGGGVMTFNGRTGAVTPQTGDYTPGQVGAEPSGSTNTHNESDDAHAGLFEQKADVNHTHSGYLTEHQDISGKLDKSGGTMTGALTAKSHALNVSGVRNIKAGTADLTPGVSSLPTGDIYFAYE